MPDFDNVSANVFDEFAGKSNTEVAAALKEIEAEEKRLDLEIKREQVAAIRAKRQQQLDIARDKNISLRNFMATRLATQAHCNHRKGGLGYESIVRGEGTAPMYCVIKHKLPMGEYWVICQRCGREWFPPQPYTIEGGRVVSRPATAGWQEAVNWPSDNTPSQSSIFFFKKNEEVSA